jgi:hypothetical protein
VDRVLSDRVETVWHHIRGTWYPQLVPVSSVLDGQVTHPYQKERPDFGKYVNIRTLSEKEFPVGMADFAHMFRNTGANNQPDEPGRRVIIVGDIHGMFKPFQWVAISSL